MQLKGSKTEANLKAAQKAADDEAKAQSKALAAAQKAADAAHKAAQTAVAKAQKAVEKELAAVIKTEAKLTATAPAAGGADA